KFKEFKVLEWLESIGFRYNQNTIDELVSEGVVDVAEWLIRNKKMYPSPAAIQMAQRSGYFVMVDLLRKLGSEMNIPVQPTPFPSLQPTFQPPRLVQSLTQDVFRHHPSPFTQPSPFAQPTSPFQQPTFVAPTFQAQPTSPFQQPTFVAPTFQAQPTS